MATREEMLKFLGDDICNILPDRYKNLYLRICYEIIRFLRNDENRLLFFRIPIEEFTNDVNQQDEDWRTTCDIISLALRLSLKQENINPANLNYPGDWYNHNDRYILIPNQNDNERYYYLSGKQNNNGNTTLTFTWENIPGRGAFAPTIQQKNEIISTAQAIYKISDIPNQLNRGYEICLQEMNILQYTPQPQSEYSKGILICSPYPINGMQHSGKYILPIVQTSNGQNRINLRGIDIAAIAGDRAIINTHQRLINGLSPRGPLKKLIIIGSEETQILRENNPQTVILTFQEINNYCAPNEIQYYEPKFISVEFPWVQTTLQNLNDILQKYQNNINDETKKHIYNYSKRIFTDIRFDRNKLSSFKDFFIDFLNQTLEGNNQDDIYNELEEWCINLVYEDDTNPKYQYAKNNNAAATVDRNHSIRNQVRNIQNNAALIVIDAPLHTNRNINKPNPITTVMRYHTFARVVGVYYDGIEDSLKKYSEKEFMRDPLFTNRNQDTPETNEFSLDDYLDYETPYSDGRIYEIDRTYFTDGSSDTITGDVLIYEQDESYKRTDFKDIENPSGLTITYYSSNQENSKDFAHLLNIHCKLPTDKNIEYYSSLWQNGLKQLIQPLNEEEVDAFCQEMGISRIVLLNHINGVSKFMRKNTMNKILKKLIESNAINKEESGYIMAARKFMHGTSISFGLKLKDAIFDYMLNPEGKGMKFLQNLIGDSNNYTIERIKEIFINTKTIK